MKVVLSTSSPSSLGRIALALARRRATVATGFVAAPNCAGFGAPPRTTTTARTPRTRTAMTTTRTATAGSRDSCCWANSARRHRRSSVTNYYNNTGILGVPFRDGVNSVGRKSLSSSTTSSSTAMSSTATFSSTGTAGKGINKVMESATDALRSLPIASSSSSSSWDGLRVGVGGFGLGGIPESLLRALADHDRATNLVVSSLTAGTDEQGVGVLLQVPNKVRRLLSSYVGENKLLEQMYFDGRLELELVPQGTLAERWNAAGGGIPAFYTPTGAATLYANGGLPVRYGPNMHVVQSSEPKETRVFHDDDEDGIEYVLERSLPTDLSLVKAAVADTLGNCRFVGTSQNSNPDCAKAAKFCVVEAESIVEAGTLHPDDIHLPGIYVSKVVPATTNNKPIERLKLSNSNAKKASSNVVDTTTGRSVILRRAAKEFQNGMYVNLGIGLPTLASNFVPSGITILLQTENGLLGMGPYPSAAEQASPDWINAGKETITALPGASSFSSSDSFRMIRAGRVDLTLLGGLQVSRMGDLASWTVPGKIIKGMGGAMDLVGAPKSKVVVTMDHVAKDGSPKLVEACTLPLTGHAVVDRIITDMGVFDCDKKGGTGLTLVEISPYVSLQDVQNATGCDFRVVPGPIPLMVDEP